MERLSYVILTSFEEVWRKYSQISLFYAIVQDQCASELQWCGWKLLGVVHNLFATGCNKGLLSCPWGVRRCRSDPEVTADAFVKKSLSWWTKKLDNPKELNGFGVFLSEYENAIKSFDATKVSEYCTNFKQILNKLPYSRHNHWRNIVYQTKEKGDSIKFGDSLFAEKLRSWQFLFLVRKQSARNKAKNTDMNKPVSPGSDM